jgi:hypothetical protein
VSASVIGLGMPWPNHCSVPEALKQWTYRAIWSNASYAVLPLFAICVLFKKRFSQLFSETASE